MGLLAGYWKKIKDSFKRIFNNNIFRFDLKDPRYRIMATAPENTVKHDIGALDYALNNIWNK